MLSNVNKRLETTAGNTFATLSSQESISGTDDPQFRTMQTKQSVISALEGSIQGKGRHSRNMTTMESKTAENFIKRDDLQKSQNFFYQTLKNNDHTYMPTSLKVTPSPLHVMLPLPKKEKIMHNSRNCKVSQSLTMGKILQANPFQTQRPVTSQQKKPSYKRQPQN